MSQKKKTTNFKTLLKKYLDIKGLDIVIVLENGKEIELLKNRKMINDEIIMSDKLSGERRIPLSTIKTVDMYAA